ncbi:MAG: FHA domain-containing protein [Acidimicrobiales bacterium]
MAGAVLVGPATDYSAIIRPLQWLAVALVFLFFLRVIRAVWVEARPAGPRPARAERRRSREERAPAPDRHRQRRPLGLVVVEPPARASERHQLGEETTVGRSPGCAIPTADDMYSSTLHARLFHHGEHLWVEDLGSTNGTFVNSERISRPTRLARGDLLQVGGTVFEVSR